mmetsp:Transcript_15480/g.20084  ORF Transcript_15480/g.20084 Transcript_15480/m.20084 type:complete len:331 (+) Transcript_15480:1531-2523(+)
MAKVDQEQRESRARNHLGRKRSVDGLKQKPPRRRHSLSAPERVNMMVSLFTRHHAIVASVSKNPLTRGENDLFTYRSGARTDDDVSYAKLKKRFQEDTDGGYFALDRMSKQQWEDEKTLIEDIAIANDYDLDYEGIGSRPTTTASRGQTPKTASNSRPNTTKSLSSRPNTSKSVKLITKEEEEEEKDENDKIDNDDSKKDDLEEEGEEVEGGAQEVWTQAYAADGTEYFYNSLGETAWELPDGASAQLEWSQGDGEEGEWDEGEWDEGDWEEGEDYEGDWGENAEEWDVEEWGQEDGWEGYDDENGEWEEMMDAEGFTYWLNSTTGETQY